MKYTIIHNALSPDIWNAALLRSESASAYQQSSAYAAAAAALGAQIEQFAVCRENNTEPVALAQFHIKKFFRFYTIALCMRGPVWCERMSDKEKQAIYQLLTFEISKMIRWPSQVLWMPETETEDIMRTMKRRRIVTGYHTVMLDLRQEEQTLLAQQEGKWRNRLRASQKANITLTHGGKAPKLTRYGWLLEKEVEQSTRIGYAALTPALVPAFQAAAPSGKADNVYYLQATDPASGTEPVGAMLFLLHGHTATYHIGWANGQGKAQNIHNRLLWEAMLALKKRNIKWLDLGGISDDSVGIKRFKLGTGAQVHSLAGTYL